MNIYGIVMAIAIVGGVGLLIAVFLSIFGAKFKVEVNEKEEAVLAALPGNNCGGCGYPGCAGLAKAIAENEAPVSGCPVGGAPVAEAIGQIMGVKSGTLVRKVAFVKCSGTCDLAKNEYEYEGPKNCKMASVAPGKGEKSCSYGCLGYGTCKSVCENDAISIIGGIAYVNPDKCIGCQKCTKVCPKGLIEMVPFDAGSKVACNSKDKGPAVMKACKAGCVGCGMCQKVCESDAIEVNDFLAHVDYEKCTDCGKCKEKCPKNVIV